MRSINVTCTTNPVKRSTGGNAVAAAAYRAGEDLTDTQSGEVKRYSNRQPDVRDSFILAPTGAPDWSTDRSDLWNAAEIRETYKNGRPGRDVILGFAWETSAEEQKAMAVEFAQKHFVSTGHVCDIAFHKYGSTVRESDKIRKDKTDTTITGKEQVEIWKQQGLPFLESYQTHGVDMPHVKIERLKGGDIKGHKIYQPHAHVLVTTRALGEDGWAKRKTREFDSKATTFEWRESWEKLQNTHLERLGYDVRVKTTRETPSEAPEAANDLPSTPDRQKDIEKLPEGLSDAARHKERRGEETMEGKKAAANQVTNDLIAEIGAQGAANDNDESSFHRISIWWRNMSESFSDWRDQFKEKASAFLDYLAPNKDEQERGQDHEPD